MLDQIRRRLEQFGVKCLGHQGFHSKTAARHAPLALMRQLRIEAQPARGRVPGMKANSLFVLS